MTAHPALMDRHVDQLHHKCVFKQTYRMSHAAFMKLQELLGDRIQLSTRFSPGVEPIPVQIVMASGLRWRTGCPCLDIHISVGINSLYFQYIAFKISSLLQSIQHRN